MNLKWLGLSAGLFLVIYAFTYYQDPIETDDYMLSNLKQPVSLVEPRYLNEPPDRPLESCRDCFVRDRFAGKTGSGCLWSQFPPVLSCRIRGLPVTLLMNSRMGGAQEVPITLLWRAIGPLPAIRMSHIGMKLCFLAALWWILGIFSLPRQLLPFFAISPLFHGGFNIWHSLVVQLLSYLTVGLSVSKGRAGFVAALCCLLAGMYIWTTFLFVTLPAVLLLLFFRRDPRRALIFCGSAGAILIARTLVALAHPVSSNELKFWMLDSPIWVKTGGDVLIFLRDLYGMLSLSSGWVDLVPPESRSGPILSAAWIILRLLGLTIIAMLGVAAVYGDQKERGRIRVLLGFFLIYPLPFFMLGHNNIPEYLYRFLHAAPVPVAAAYLSAGACAALLRKRGWHKLASGVMPWLWGVAILGCVHWVFAFRQSGPPISQNAAYASRLAEHLARRGAVAPVIISENGAPGILDLLSGENVRPIYLDWGSHEDISKESVESYLLPWTLLGKGTLLQRKQQSGWEGFSMTLSELERFARSHAIEITGVEFFPYYGDQGYWIIDFVNRRFR